MSAIVIGGGHNGLVAAVYLARAGVEVTVLEASETPGGCVWTEELPGEAIAERGAVDHGGIAAIAADLGLDAFGLEYVERDRLQTVLFGDGERRVFEVSAEETAAGFGADAAAYLELVRQARSFFSVLDGFASPPTMTELAAVLNGLRGGDTTFRMLLSSAEAVLERTFSDPHLRASLALYAAHGQIPAWAPGSGMLALLLPSMHGEPAVRPVGGSRALVSALVAALEAAGGKVRTGAEVTGLERVGDTGYAVTLADGDRLTADKVISTLDVKRTTNLLTAPPDAMRRAADSVTSGRFNVCELTISLTGLTPPEPFADPTGPLCFVQDRLEDLRRGFGDVIAGRLPGSPWAMAIGAGTGMWISSVVPLRRADGPWTPALEEQAAERVLASVSKVLGTDLSGDVLVTGPAAWSQRLHGDGNPNHLDLSVDQLLGWRPPGLRAPRTPLPGLYLAGAGTHPGGGLSGVSGRTAATALLTDTGRRPAAEKPWTRARQEASGLWSGLRAYRAMRATERKSR
ncbi:NAD(P)/FAD-dependent oxidoreductase [Actinocorallia sp. B10E7]|uniref:phytoene desaturase family protein n=1 Tax=Actinocorallia sp. B10E7 TaxID=3153558 RepID=UPI00325EAE65